MSIIDSIFNLKKKTIIITGGAGLLGLEYAKVLSHAGAEVVIVDLNEKIQKLKTTTSKNGLNNNIYLIETDITNKPEVSHMVTEVEDQFGKVDVLINNAAYNCPADNQKNNFFEFFEYPLDNWIKSIDINLTGMFLCCQKVIKSMIDMNIKGVIINISSTYGIVAPDQRIYSSIKHIDNNKQFIKPADYSVTKSGIINFTKYLAALYGKHGIRVNTLTPGGVWDNQDENFVKAYVQKTVLNRMADKSDYNGAILFLASDASKYMTGANLIIDGGWTCW